MPRSSYSGLRSHRGFLHADPASFDSELTPVTQPDDLLTTTAFLSRIFIRVGDRPLVIRCFDLSFGTPAPRLAGYRGGPSTSDCNSASSGKPIQCYSTCRPGEQHSSEYGVVWASAISMIYPSFGRAASRTWKGLSAREFAMRHKVVLSVVHETRKRLLGRRAAREPGWWPSPNRSKFSDPTSR